MEPISCHESRIQISQQAQWLQYIYIYRCFLDRGDDAAHSCFPFRKLMCATGAYRNSHDTATLKRLWSFDRLHKVIFRGRKGCSSSQPGMRTEPISLSASLASLRVTRETGAAAASRHLLTSPALRFLSQIHCQVDASSIRQSLLVKRPSQWVIYVDLEDAAECSPCSSARSQIFKARTSNCSNGSVLSLERGASCAR